MQTHFLYQKHVLHHDCINGELLCLLLVQKLCQMCRCGQNVYIFASRSNISNIGLWLVEGFCVFSEDSKFTLSMQLRLFFQHKPLTSNYITLSRDPLAMRYLAFSDKGDKTEVQDAHMKKPRTIGFTESGQSVTMVTLLGGKYL